MTPNQRDVLIFVREFWRKHGYAPTQAEIGAGTSINSKSGVSRNIDKLKEAGYVEFIPGNHRSVRVVSLPEGWE
jgi:SOS-response transcriptional repressor LexA